MHAGPQHRIADDVRLAIAYDDATPHGSALSGLCDRVIHSTCRDACASATDDRLPDMPGRSRAALARCFAPTALGSLYEAPGRLRESCLYPDARKVRAARLIVAVEGATPTSRVVAIEPGMACDLAAWLSQFRALGAAPRSAAARRIWDVLAECGALTDRAAAPPIAGDGLVFVGHATMWLRARGVSIVVDPFLLHAGRGTSPAYRPRHPGELAPDVILVTHSHPDHFDPGTLLGFARDVRILVPAVARESLLAIDMASRLRELGFTRVVEVAWGDEIRIGAVVIRACPFLGEQPSDRGSLHPEVRNQGCTYHVDTGDVNVLFLADAGTDALGSTAAMADELRASGRRTDVVCGGYRAWRLYPTEYVASSVPRYLLFVPPEQWDARLEIMNDADDLLDVARRLGARWAVPYANGGAPWYWERGLGPDGRPGADSAAPRFDPDLAVLRAAASRAPQTPTFAALH
ncbi:MAG TPA: MBL fold metallo-hydrolase, partial [Nannocystaceae bacterium]|nr:MBL fold metallo-hydrolase [Nannocystaceae bacterium]